MALDTVGEKRVVGTRGSDRKCTMSDGKIVITGTGRAGTSLLVAILSDLGLDTGFPPGVPIPAGRNAGLENRVRDPAAPRIVKTPAVMFVLDEIVAEGITIDHVIVPMRDLAVASASRIRVSDYGVAVGRPGGLVGTRTPWGQERLLARRFHDFMCTIAELEIPCTLLAFPRFASDWEYTHRRLGFLAPGVPGDAWKAAVEGRYAPELVHESRLTPSERVRVAVRTPAALVARGRRRLMRS